MRFGLLDDEAGEVEVETMEEVDVKKEGRSGVAASAMAASYNDQIRPLLDAVDRLRQLNVGQEGIQLPTIVVVGDQSSGKSSVLESLAGISLPRGQGICTRVPLVMRLQNGEEAKLQIEYGSGRVVPIGSEEDVAVAIDAATAEIAGSGKGISDTPITLVVRKKGVPDLTLVDLPGITRVPVQGQPEDIYDQIAGIIRAYIAPKESIILNVLSATVDFPTCESIRMSQQVDRTGERTLAVVTKADRAPEGLLEKVTVDDVRIGLGYVCVRNRIGVDDETYDEARAAERRLFEEHPLLRQIDKSMVGIPTLARRLTQIQAAIIGRCLPDIVRQINDKLSRSSDELGQMPPDLGTVADAVREFYHIVKQTRASLEKLLVRGEFDEYPDDHGRHGTARIAEMLDSYASKLQAQAQAQAQDADSSSFLVEEMRVLEETKGINLPNFLPRPAFQVLLRKKLESIEHVPHRLVTQVWDYVGDLVMGILHHHSRSYPQVQPSCRRAVQSLMDNARERSARHVKELIHMELVADYTANPDYTAKWNDMMTEGHARFLDAVEGDDVPALVTLPGFGDTDVSHLRLQRKLAGQAFDLKARLAAYWTCVVLRLVDGLALHVLYSVKRLVEKDLEDVLAAQVVGTNLDGVERMLVPSPATALKRDRLRKSIALLRECREVVANTMDKISVV